MWDLPRPGIEPMSLVLQSRLLTRRTTREVHHHAFYWNILNLKRGTMTYHLAKVIGHCGLPAWLSGKESTSQCRRWKKREFDPWAGKIALEKEMATHSSILTRRIPWTEEPGGWKSMGSQRSQTQLINLTTPLDTINTSALYGTHLGVFAPTMYQVDE